MSRLQLTLATTTAVEKLDVLVTCTELVICNRQIVSVSDGLAQLTCVARLDASGNLLVVLPSGVSAMTRLVSLSLFNNRLASLPAIGQLTALKMLDLTQNALVAVPREIGRLHALERLSFSENQIAVVPRELCQLQSLVALWLRHNRLAWLPLALDRLPAQTKVYVSGSGKQSVTLTLLAAQRQPAADRRWRAVAAERLARPTARLVCRDDLAVPARSTSVP